jgi:hypothetical protein
MHEVASTVDIAKLKRDVRCSRWYEDAMRELPIILLLFAGVASAAPAPGPKLTFGMPLANASGMMVADTKAITIVIKRSQTQLLGCYKPELQTNTTMLAIFTVGSDGRVSDSIANIETPDDPNGAAWDQISACIAATISKLTFAKPKDGQAMTVLYPLDYGGFDAHVPSVAGGERDVTGTGGSGGASATSSGKSVVRVKGERTGRVTTGLPIQILPKGELDTAIIELYVEHNMNKLSDCYERELLATKTLRGTVTAQFTIDGNGAVSASTANGLKNKHVESCMADVIKRIFFPKPKNRGDVAVNYPMTFMPEATNTTESKTAAREDKNSEVLDSIIDRNLTTNLSKFTGIRGEISTKGSQGFGPGVGPGDDSSTGPDGTAPKGIMVRFAEPSGDFGGLLVEEIDRVVKAHAGVFRACYQKELNRTPGLGRLGGKLVVHFVIGGDGAVQAGRTTIASGSTMSNDAIEQCVKRNVDHLKFPAKGGLANVNYPFLFSQGS